MKKLMIQVCIIAVLSTTIGIAYNQFLKSPLPLLATYQPIQDPESGQDLSSYYNEIDAETLRDLIDADMAVLLDARTGDKYSQNHIPQALSMPVGDFNQTYERLSNTLGEDKAIITYCIGIHCIDSSLLAKALYDKGHRELFVYKGGIEEWQALGYPLEPIEGGSPQ